MFALSVISIIDTSSILLVFPFIFTIILRKKLMYNLLPDVIT